MTLPEIEKIRAELLQLKEELSRQRKQGNDVLIAQLKTAMILPKLKMAEATKTAKDIVAAQNMLNAAKAEMPTQSVEPESFKKEPTPFNKAKDYIERAKDAAGLGKKEEAKALYSYVREYYGLLTADQKTQIARESKELAQKLK